MDDDEVIAKILKSYPPGSVFKGYKRGKPWVIPPTNPPSGLTNAIPPELDLTESALRRLRTPESEAWMKEWWGK